MGQTEPEKRTWDKERERERKKAYRERKREELNVDPALPEVDLAAEPETVERVLPPMPDLESYVKDALYMAELHHSQASPNATLSTKDLAGTLERAEAYARWRYAGVIEGSVNGL